MNDDLRFAAMNMVTTSVALIVAFGVDLSPEASAGIVAVAAAIVNLLAKLWKTGQEPGPDAEAATNDLLAVALNTPAPEVPVYSRGDVHKIVLEALRQQEEELLRYEAART